MSRSAFCYGLPGPTWRRVIISNVLFALAVAAVSAVCILASGCATARPAPAPVACCRYCDTCGRKLHCFNADCPESWYHPTPPPPPAYPWHPGLQTIPLSCLADGGPCIAYSPVFSLTGDP